MSNIQYPKVPPTLWTLNDYTLEEVYLFVRTLLLSQEAKSMDEDGSQCAYRGACNRKCAVGFLIPDKKYTIEFEGVLLNSLIVAIKYRDDDFTITGQQEELLHTLQCIHDDAPVNEWRELMPSSFEKFLGHNYDLADMIRDDAS